MASLKFNAVTVRYPVYHSRGMSLHNHLVRISTGGSIERESGRVQMVTALQDVSFELRRGDAVGLVGHNGAGKSTLLRTMVGIYSSTQGSEFAAGTTNEDGADYNSSINSRPSPEHAFFKVVSISPLSGLTGVGCYFCNICRRLQPLHTPGGSSVVRSRSLRQFN